MSELASQQAEPGSKTATVAGFAIESKDATVSSLAPGEASKPAIVAALLSRQFDAGELRRLVSAWADPEVTIRAIERSFRLAEADLELLKLALGAKTKPSPLSPWWRPERVRRVRRGWA